MRPLPAPGSRGKYVNKDREHSDQQPGDERPDRARGDPEGGQTDPGDENARATNDLRAGKRGTVRRSVRITGSDQGTVLVHAHETVQHEATPCGSDRRLEGDDPAHG